MNPDGTSTTRITPLMHGAGTASVPAGQAVPTLGAAVASRKRKSPVGRHFGERRPAGTIPCPVCDHVLPSGEWSLCPEHLVMQLRRLGVRIDVPRSPRFLTLQEVADALRVSVSWVRKNLDHFPHRIQLSGGDRRIPLADVEAFAAAAQEIPA